MSDNVWKEWHIGHGSHHSGSIHIFAVPVGASRWALFASADDDRGMQDDRFIGTVLRPRPRLFLSGKHNECRVVDCTFGPMLQRDVAALPAEFTKLHKDVRIEEWDDDFRFNVPVEHPEYGTGFQCRYDGDEYIAFPDGGVYAKEWRDPYFPAKEQRNGTS
jgi:hypothetical protein